MHTHAYDKMITDKNNFDNSTAVDNNSIEETEILLTVKSFLY